MIMSQMRAWATALLAMPRHWDDYVQSFIWTFNHSELFNFAKSGFIPGFCVSPPFRLTLLRVQGNDGDARQPKSCRNSDPFIRWMTEHTKLKELMIRTPQEGIRKTKEKAAGGKMYIDIWCKMALSSILSLLGQQMHQDPHWSSFSH